MKAIAFQAYKILKSQLFQKKAGDLLGYFENKLGNTTDKKTELATKDDLIRLEMKIEAKMDKNKREIIRWMFIFLLVLLIMICVLFKYFIKPV